MDWEQDDTFLARWISGELSDEERKEFESSPEGKEFIEMMGATNTLKPPAYDVDAEFAKLQSRIASADQPEAKVIRFRPFVLLAVAASFAVLIGLAIFSNLGQETIETQYGEMEEIALPDGSSVQLNSASELAFNEGSFANKRSLTLDGEAFFKVQKGVTFTVETSNGLVEVLGTSFNVKSREQTLEVLCYSGKVEVRGEFSSRKLSLGQKVIFENGELIEFREMELNQKPSWISGIVELDRVSFNQVVNELQYTYNLNIEYDGSLDDKMYTGAFPNNDIDKALKLVFTPLNVDYEYIESQKTVRVKNRK